MKKAALTVFATAAVACFALTGCTGESLTFSVADSTDQVTGERNSGGQGDCGGVTSSDVQDIVGADLGDMYITPFNINASQFDVNSCTWSDDSQFVAVAAIHKPVFPEQVVSCNLPPLRGQEGLNIGDGSSWWTWTKDGDFGKGVVTVCDGGDRIHVQVRAKDGDQSEIKKQAQQLAKLALKNVAKSDN